MKKFLLFAAVVLFISAQSIATAQSKKKDDNDKFRIVLSLKDGRQIDGYIRSSLNFPCKKVEVSESPAGEIMSFPTSEISWLTYPPVGEYKDTISWYPIRYYGYFKMKYGKSSEPSMFRMVYDGKYFKGYASRQVTSTTGGYMGNTVTQTLSTVFFYLAPEDDAVQQIPVYSGKIREKKITNYLKNYPEEYAIVMKQLIDDGKITQQDIDEDPLIFVKVMDVLAANKE